MPRPHSESLIQVGGPRLTLRHREPCAIHASHSFEAPVTPGVKFHDLLTVSLGGVGVIDHVINDTGAAAQGSATVPVNLVSFP